MKDIHIYTKNLKKKKIGNTNKILVKIYKFDDIVMEGYSERKNFSIYIRFKKCS